MEIVTVMHDFRGGGAEKAAVMLADGFARLSASSEIFCISRDGPMLAEASPGLRTTCFNVRRAYDALPALVRLMRQRPNAFFLSHLTHMNTVVALAALLAGHRRTFVVEHNDFKASAADVDDLRVRLAYWVAPRLYRYVVGIFCVSESVRDSLGTLGTSKTRSFVVANPISPQRLIAQAEAKSCGPTLDGDATILLACGRLTSQKNYPLMLRAIKQIAERQSVRLIVLGDGPDRDDLKTMAEHLRIDNIVDFYGFVENPHYYFARARLLISTSDWEGFPLTFIEALYCGIDFVSTRSCSAISELSRSGSYGTVVDREDAEAFVAAVLERLERPVAPAADKRAFLAKYEVDRVANDYARTMTSAIEKGFT